MGTQSFTIADLRVFDAAHLREVVRDATGAVPPTTAGVALQRAAPELQEYVERALAPAPREAFGRRLRREATPAEIAAARRTMLDRLFWDLTYWKAPEEYHRLTAGEEVHLGALDFGRIDDRVVLDAGAGTGRVTLPIAARARKVYALDPAPGLLALLEERLRRHNRTNVDLLRGVFRRIPLPDDTVDAVISCSAFGPLEVRGGRSGLDEFYRVTRPGGRLVIIWPEDPDWFCRHGFRYVVLPGRLHIHFATLADACEACRRFYGPEALRHIKETQRPELPFALLGVKEPRDLCWKVVEK
jgi:SAM-dependent methyltransferase